MNRAVFIGALLAVFAARLFAAPPLEFVAAGRRIKDRRPAVRAAAAGEIVKAGRSEHGEKILLDAARAETNLTVRASIYRALGRVGAESSAVVLRPAAADKSNPQARLSAMLSLGQIKDAASAEMFRNMILDPAEETEIKIQAANALSYIGDGNSVRILEEMLKDENPVLRKQALTSMGLILSDVLLQERKNIMEAARAGDPDEGVRRHAEEVLKKYQTEQTNQEE